MLVLDASVIVELVLNTPLGLRCAERALGSAESLHAPHLLDIELLQVLRRLTLSKDLTTQAADAALEIFSSLIIERHEHVGLAPRIWELRSSVTAYDAAYVALAEVLASALLTCDAKLSRSHGHRADIELVR